jgi:hypothetical protein
MFQIAFTFIFLYLFSISTVIMLDISIIFCLSSIFLPLHTLFYFDLSLNLYDNSILNIIVQFLVMKPVKVPVDMKTLI